jgi:AraC-like DNA-binding protein
MQAHSPRIAFLLASLHTGSARGLWPELIAAAQSHRCILFVLPGGRLNAVPGFEHMRNGVYRYARSPNIDSALCWASTLSGYATEATVEQFLLDTVNVPLVTFGLKIGEHPFVGIDAYSGMKALIKHFIRAHRKRRIAFIAGPRQHSSAEERYRAYCDALNEAHIAYDSSLVCLDIPWTEGRRAALQLLDERGLVPGKDFDALCAASDLLAFEAGLVLRERGMEIPFDIPIGGFNDSEESRIFSPPLTTVHMPFSHQALCALRLLSEMRKGTPPADMSLKTKLIIRSSCGCMLNSVRKAGRSRTWADLSPDLIEAFKASLSVRQDRSFLVLLARMLDANIGVRGEVRGLQNTLSALRVEFLKRAGSSGEAERTETLIHQGMVAVCLAEERKYEYRLWKEKQDEQKLNLFNQELLCAKDMESIISAAAAHLPELGIASAYLMTRDKQGALMFRGGFRQEKEHFPVEIVRPRRSCEIVPQGCFLPDRMMPAEPGAYFVLPLFFESTDLGHLVVQAIDIDPSLYEEIRSILSSALRGIMLFEEGDEARKRAERAEKSKSDIVAVISRELRNSIDTFNASAESDTSGRVVSGLEVSGLQVSRLKELVRYLLDLSQAKSDVVLAKAALFDPYAFCVAWARGQCADSTYGLKIECAEPPSMYPALYGDTEQLARILSILARLFAEMYQTAELKLSIAVLTRGCALTLSLPSVLSSRGDIPDLPKIEKDIRLELARQISILHGGQIHFAKERDGVSVTLCLPYPSMNGAIRNISDDSKVVCFIGPDQSVIESAFSLSADESFQVLPYNAVFNQEISKVQRMFLYLDPASIDHESSAALAFILDQDVFQRAECYIALHASSEGAYPMLRQSADAAGFLRSVLLSDSPSAILMIGSETALHPGMVHIQHLTQEAGIRLVACASPAAAEAALNRWHPVLFLALEPKLETQGYGPLLRRFPTVPLIAASRSFEAKEEWTSVLERPHTIFCNTGEVFSGLLTNLVQRSMEGQNFLPSPTACIVAKCIFFINKTYAEQLSRWKLASLLNTSEDYLSRIFHKQMGVSLWEYLARLRVVNAIDMLRSTGASLAEIADRTGFKDEAYFCRVFKKMTGATPGSFRIESFAEVRKVQESD